MQHTSDYHAVSAVIKLPAQAIKNMRCRAASARGQLDMEGLHTGSQIVPTARARALRILGDHLDRPLDEPGIPLALQWSELLPVWRKMSFQILTRSVFARASRQGARGRAGDGTRICAGDILNFRHREFRDRSRVSVR
jgi:hypothetical protein